MHSLLIVAAVLIIALAYGFVDRSRTGKVNVKEDSRHQVSAAE